MIRVMAFKLNTITFISAFFLISTVFTNKVIYYRNFNLYNFRFVSSIQYISLEIPEDTINFTWNIQLNKTSPSCNFPDSWLGAQYGSFPYSNSLDGSSYPSNYVKTKAQYINGIYNEEPVVINYPIYGQWFLGAVMASNPNDVIGSLLASSCKYGFSGNITIDTAEVDILNVAKPSILTFTKQKHYYKFRIDEEAYKMNVIVSESNFKNSTLYFSSASLPDPLTSQSFQHLSDPVHKVTMPAGDVDKWFYLLFEVQDDLDKDSLKAKLQVTFDKCVGGVLRKHNGSIPCYLNSSLKSVVTVTDVQNTFFSYDNSSNDFMVVPRAHVSMTSFKIDHIRDVGGFLLLKLQVVPIAASYSLLSDIKVNFCIQRGSPPIATNLTLHCNNPEALVTLYKNKSSAELNIAFPEPGTYFIGYQDTSNNSTNLILQNTQKSFNVTSLKDDLHFKNVTYGVMLKADVSKCEHNKCHNNGRCQYKLKGAYIISSCFCIAGSKGLTCNDTSHMMPLSLQIVYTLLLTLSNLFFIPAIIIAFKRHYYTESVIYMLNMFFSTFYHACDMSSWSVYNWCLMSYSTLQYSDFLISLLSFWFTLMAMTRIRNGFLLVLTNFGMVVIAILVSNNATGVATNAIPISTGIAIIAITWGINIYKSKSWFPSKMDYCWMIPGVVLALLGILTFALFQNDINYPYTHSFWHFAVAVSVPFLIPRQVSSWKMTPSQVEAVWGLSSSTDRHELSPGSYANNIGS